MGTSVKKVITAQDSWTDYLSIGRDGATVVIEDTSSMIMTVVLQVIPDGESTPVDTGDTWTAEGAHDIGALPDLQCRVGVKTGGYTSGTATVWLHRKQ